MKKHLLLATALLALPGCFKTRQEIAREKEDTEVRSTIQQNIADYSQNLERVQADVGRLQGRIEELEHNRKKEMSGLVSGRESDQKTLEDLRAKLGALQEGQTALFEEIKKLKEDNLALASERARPAPAVAAPPASSGKKKVNAGSFESAVGAYKAKDFEAAAVQFRAFLDANPKSKRTLDAHFFLGDSLYKQKQYEQAVVEFGAVHEKAADSPLGRRATLKIAQSFKAMNKMKDAKAFAQLLIQSAPNSPEAKSARKLLK